MKEYKFMKLICAITSGVAVFLITSGAWINPVGDDGTRSVCFFIGAIFAGLTGLALIKEDGQ
jgi:hypothetical protein